MQERDALPKTMDDVAAACESLIMIMQQVKDFNPFLIDITRQIKLSVDAATTAPQLVVSEEVKEEEEVEEEEVVEEEEPRDGAASATPAADADAEEEPLPESESESEDEEEESESESEAESEAESEDEDESEEESEDEDEEEEDDEYEDEVTLLRKSVKAHNLHIIRLTFLLATWVSMSSGVIIGYLMRN